MKKYTSLALLVFSVFVFSYCNSAKKATATTSKSTVFYETDIRSLVEAKCSPCHIPAKGGRKESLDTYDAVKKNIDDVIRRIEMNPGDPGFMPFKHPKLSEAEIKTFRTWREEGMANTK
jgi:hypothetical protein